MSDSQTLQQLLQSHFQDADIQIAQEGSKFDVRVVSVVFEGLRSIKRQQLVYAALGDLITSGAVHAVSINAVTPAEWKEQSRFGSTF